MKVWVQLLIAGAAWACAGTAGAQQAPSAPSSTAAGCAPVAVQCSMDEKPLVKKSANKMHQAKKSSHAKRAYRKKTH